MAWPAVCLFPWQPDLPAGKQIVGLQKERPKDLRRSGKEQRRAEEIGLERENVRRFRTTIL